MDILTDDGVLLESKLSIDLVKEPEANKLRHIFNPTSNLHLWRPDLTMQEVVDIARVRRIELVALCGVRLVPTQNPEDVKETCDICLDIAGIMIDNPPE